MKRTLVTLAVLTILCAGCATIPIDRVVNDLQAAEARAIAANDPVGMKCWHQVNLYVPQLKIAAVKPVGVFDAAEQHHILQLLLRQADSDVQDACAPLKVDARKIMRRAAGLRVLR